MPLFIATIRCLSIIAHGPSFCRRHRLNYGGQLFDGRKFKTILVATVAAAAEPLLRGMDAHARMEWRRNQQLRHNSSITLLGRLLPDQQLRRRS
jgi:lipopolysaccharide/colanic/teichoic acid biosynthesis glycosyltransferase